MGQHGAAEKDRNLLHDLEEEVIRAANVESIH